MRPESERQFTLVELMIVVAIIAVLAAIAIPLLRTMAYRARIAEVAPNVDGIHRSVTAFDYATDSALISINPYIIQPTTHPRLNAALDGTAAPWTTPPSEWEPAAAFVPDGAVRCDYFFTYAMPPAVPSLTIEAAGNCDVDNDDTVYGYGLVGTSRTETHSCKGGTGPTCSDVGPATCTCF